MKLHKKRQPPERRLSWSGKRDSNSKRLRVKRATERLIVRNCLTDRTVLFSRVHPDCAGFLVHEILHIHRRAGKDVVNDPLDAQGAELRRDDRERSARRVTSVVQVMEKKTHTVTNKASRRRMSWKRPRCGNPNIAGTTQHT